MKFVWQQEAAALPPAVAAAHGLEVWCDGGGHRRWGTGVYIPHLGESYQLGGDSRALGALVDARGVCDGAVAETLAMAHGLSVVHELRVRGRHVALTRAGVHLVVDSTCVVAGRMRGHSHHSPQLDLAVRHLQRQASKVLQAVWWVRV